MHWQAYLSRLFAISYDFQQHLSQTDKHPSPLYLFTQINNPLKNNAIIRANESESVLSQSALLKIQHQLQAEEQKKDGKQVNRLESFSQPDPQCSKEKECLPQ